jgi:hypothetical protein
MFSSCLIPRASVCFFLCYNVLVSRRSHPTCRIPKQPLRVQSLHEWNYLRMESCLALRFSSLLRPMLPLESESRSIGLIASKFRDGMICQVNLYNIQCFKLSMHQ